MTDTTTATATMVVLEPEQWEYVKDRNKFWQLMAILGFSLALVSVSALLVDRYFDSRRDSRLETIAEENHDALEILRNQTSPETQAQRDAALKELLIVVDCNQRSAIQDLANQLVEQGLIKPVTVVCQENQ